MNYINNKKSHFVTKLAKKREDKPTVIEKAAQGCVILLALNYH